MPKGSPTSRTKAAEKYQKKIGYITKGFKMRKEVAEEFKAACDSAGVSQSGQIVKMMQDFISSVEKGKR